MLAERQNWAALDGSASLVVGQWWNRRDFGQLEPHQRIDVLRDCLQGCMLRRFLGVIRAGS